MIRDVSKDDIPAITALYNHYVLTSEATFELEPLTEKEMTRRIEWVLETAPFIVDVDHSGELRGFAYVHPWKERAAYYRTYEDTIYLAPDCKGQGLGTALMTELLARCRQCPTIHSIIACITETNALSIAFHERFGFKKVSHFKEVGTKFGQVLDVVDMQLIL